MRINEIVHAYEGGIINFDILSQHRDTEEKISKTKNGILYKNVIDDMNFYYIEI